MINSAIISDCGKYRYELCREWHHRKPKVMFMMLNPSTADENSNDLTTIRCMNFAKKWGFGGIYIGNLYPFRAKSPKNLKKWLNSDEYSLNINIPRGIFIEYLRPNLSPEPLKRYFGRVEGHRTVDPNSGGLLGAQLSLPE